MKIPKIKLPSKQQIKKAMPTVLAVASVIGNTASTLIFIKETINATLTVDNLKNEGATKAEIAKEVAPKFILPTVIFVAAQICTIECNVLNKKQQLGLTTALIGADYRLRKAKEDKNVAVETPPKFVDTDIPTGGDKILIYDEYLETGKQDGYFAMREADWWKAYANIQTKINSMEYGGEITYRDFYSQFPNKRYFEEKLAALGSWPDLAGWDVSDWGSTQFATLDEGVIDEYTGYKIVHWYCPPMILADDYDKL